MIEVTFMRPRRSLRSSFTYHVVRKSTFKKSFSSVEDIVRYIVQFEQKLKNIDNKGYDSDVKSRYLYLAPASTGHNDWTQDKKMWYDFRVKYAMFNKKHTRTMVDV